MTTETVSVPQADALRATDRILQTDLKTMTLETATELGMRYFMEERNIFERRMVALRSVVPENVRTAWDTQAEKYAQISQAIHTGDTRPVKEFVLKAGMDLNKQAQNPDNKHIGRLGRALYTVGSRMQVTLGSPR